MEERISIKEASEILGMHEHCIRRMMQNKEIDIGFCVKHGRNYNYFIYRAKVMKLVGKES